MSKTEKQLPLCIVCKGETERGYLNSNASGWYAVGDTYIEKLIDKRRQKYSFDAPFSPTGRLVVAYRCTECGFLNFYATD